MIIANIKLNKITAMERKMRIRAIIIPIIYLFNLLFAFSIFLYFTHFFLNFQLKKPRPRFVYSELAELLPWAFL